MNFNVITPMARVMNTKLLIRMLEPMNITWHVITDEDMGYKLQFDKPWIKSYVYSNNENEFWARSNASINWFIDNHVTDDEYWCILNDDDAYEFSFFNNLIDGIQEAQKNGNDAKVIICAMERGYRIPDGLPPEKQHPPTRLPALPEYTKVGSVGVEQIIITGDILKKYRIPLNVVGDGMLIEEIANKENVLYLDNANVWFNYYELGRW